MSEEERRIPWIFFLGAGASVASKVPSTREFVIKFKDHLMNINDGEIPIKFRPYLESLEAPNDDVEALLELLHECREIEHKPLGKTVRLNKGINPEDAENMLSLLESFVHETCYVKRENTEYLSPLMTFLEAVRRPLDIFSVNYDTAIEVFCFTHDLEFNNGFQRTWAPASLMLDEKGININLLKLHGSATWWLTEEGRLVEIPLELQADGARTYYGSQAESLIVYPYDPRKKVPISTLDLLPILRERLENTDVAIVVGYSFRDQEIREIFLDAARKNRRLRLVLIGPSSYRTYRNRLSETKKEVSSPLSQKVLCLPFLFEKVFPHLRHEFLSPFINGSDACKGIEWSEMMSGESDHDISKWKATVIQLAKAGHFEKVIDIIEGSPLEKWGFEVMLEIIPNTYLMASLSFAREEQIVKKWIDWMFSKIMKSVRLVPDNQGEADKWRGKVTVWFPDLGNIDRPTHLKSKVRDKADEVENLMSMARQEDIPVTLKSFHNALTAISEYLEKRWATDKPIDLARFADDGCLWNEDDWSPLKSMCEAEDGWFDSTFLEELENTEKKTFRMEISKHWKISASEDEK